MSEQLAPETDANVEDAQKERDPFAPSDDTDIPEPTLGEPVKRRRTAKVDSTLAAAKDVALAAVHEIAPEGSIGPVHHVRAEEERLTTHLFECDLPGYRGWFWFATLSRVPRSKVATVCEIGLLPGDDALLAPAWIPWADRIQEGDEEAFEGLEDATDAEDVDDLTADSAEESSEDSTKEAEHSESSEDDATE